MRHVKKFIEVALPLQDVNREAAREKSIRHGHPSTLHLWWARRPLAACRAVLFASLVDDPSECVEKLLADPGRRQAAEKLLSSQKKSWDDLKAVFAKAGAAGVPASANPHPGLEPTLEGIIAEVERERIFNIIRELVKWENSNNETVLNTARAEIARSLAWARGEEPPTTPGAVLDYLQKYAPPVYDPFCGGGSIPLEAQRLGLEAHASDLNPVPVLITKALIEIPPKFAVKPPVNPESRRQLLGTPASLPASGEEDAARMAALQAETVRLANLPLITPPHLMPQPSPDSQHKQWFSRGYLPHFDQPGLVQSITFRLFDSLPKEVIDRWKLELGLPLGTPASVPAKTQGPQRAGRDAGVPANLDAKEAELRERIDRYEDAGHGACFLRDPRIAELVENALLHFDNQRYRLVAWCVMPNHVHTLIETFEDWPLDKILHSWKSYTSSEANKILGRSGDFWMRAYHDRFMRNHGHLVDTLRYIEQNPVKAGLMREAGDWRFSSAWRGCAGTPASLPAQQTQHPHASKDAGAPTLAGRDAGVPGTRKGAAGLAEDIRYYGQWMRDEAEKRIGHLYPKVAVAQEKDGSYRHATPDEIINRKS